MTKEQEKVYLWIKNRYDRYLQDKVKCDLHSFCINDKAQEVLKSVGIKCDGVLMRKDVPETLKAFEKIRQIPLF